MTSTSLRWQVEYGNGGWVRVTGDAFPGWLYLRIRLDTGRPVLTELYLDSREGEVSAKMLRDLPLANMLAFVHGGELSRLETSGTTVGPDLSRLASHFRTNFGDDRHWVADSMRAQVPGSGVATPKYGPKPPPLGDYEAPEPLRFPEHGLTDAFLRSVAENYAYAVRMRKRPGPELARMSGASVRTVHGWVSKARQRGIMPPASKGRVS